MLQDWISAVESWVPALAESLWVYPALVALATVDGFFPPVPSESVVIALASLSVAHGEPHLALVALAAAVGAFAGDQIAYTIGSRVDVRRLRLFRTARGRQALAWAEHALAHRGSSFILAARYIPVGRVAVNMTAGALGYPRKRFVGLTALAGLTWAAYGTLVGAGAGIWLADHPLIAVVAGVVVGTAVGFLIDWVLRRWTSVGRGATPLGGAVADDAPDGSGPAGTAGGERPAPDAAPAGGEVRVPVGVAPAVADPAPALAGACPPDDPRVTSRQRSGRRR